MTAPTPFALDRLLAELTLEEKASLLSGSDFWHTQGVDRGEVAVPAVMVTDGPHGLRKQATAADHLGLGDSVPATCFPTASSLGSTWDVDLLRRVGQALGKESAAEDVAVLLGPGANIKRSPLCGRNFEYLSEDPVLSGDLAAAIITGIQSQGVGTSLKHFAVNNQESDRMRVSADVDERTLREIYLASFERAVAADPWTIMCAYNKVNDTYASQNRWLLTEVLREQWGWDGLVMSDWGAVRDRVAALEAGMDLEMPSSGGRTDAEVVAAVRDGSLDEAVVDIAVRRLLTLLNRTFDAVQRPEVVDVDAHHALAREAAASGAVLLKNDPVDGAPLLPLTSGDSVVVIGEFARTPRYQGAGSSLVHPTRLDDALSAFETAFGSPAPFAPGFTIDEGPAGDDDTLLAEALTAAAEAQTVVLFLGLPASFESEGYDRTDLDLPANQRRLVAALADAGARVVVVLSNGSVVSVAGWGERVPAILEGWLGGQAAASGIVDVLTGAVSPSGRLAETVPLRLQDTPSYDSFPGELGHVRYGEGVMVGYRWYDTRAMDVAFPFGHGLSYTTFEIADVTASATGSGSDARLSVAARVTNTGSRSGAEVVQVYVGDPEAVVRRPERELKAFAKVTLTPGESTAVTFDLDSRALAFWHTTLEQWHVEGGEFVVSVGASSRDLRGSVRLMVEGDTSTVPLTRMSTVAEFLANPTTRPAMREAVSGGGAIDPDQPSLVSDMPAIVMVEFGLAGMDVEGLDSLVAQAASAQA